MLEAVVFDLDGVLTDTASLHLAAWRDLFDPVLARHGQTPLSLSDYRRLIDGRSRTEGVDALLADRGIELPPGAESDPPGTETVRGLAAAKDGLYLERLEREGPRPYPGSLEFVSALRAGGARTAVASASHHARQALIAAGLAELFDAVVDGVEADRLGLPGKPDPALFLEAARLLDVAPARAAVIEDAEAGVEAGRRGGFGLVVGVARNVGEHRSLRAHGAGLVVDDLDELDAAALLG